MEQRHIIQHPLTGERAEAGINGVNMIYAVLRGPDNDHCVGLKGLTTAIVRSFVPHYSYGTILRPNQLMEFLGYSYDNTDHAIERLAVNIGTAGRHFLSHMYHAFGALHKMFRDDEFLRRIRAMLLSCILTPKDEISPAEVVKPVRDFVYWLKDALLPEKVEYEVADQSELSYVLENPVRGEPSRLFQTGKIDDVSEVYQALRGPDWEPYQEPSRSATVKLTMTSVIRSFVSGYGYGMITQPFWVPEALKTYEESKDEATKRFLREARLMTRHFTHHMYAAVRTLLMHFPTDKYLKALQRVLYVLRNSNETDGTLSLFIEWLWGGMEFDFLERQEELDVVGKSGWGLGYSLT